MLSLSPSDLVDRSVASDNADHSPKALYAFSVAALDYCNSTMALPEMQQLMHNDSFDMVIACPIGGKLLSGLASHFKCPLVYITPIRAPFTVANFMGNPAQLHITPSVISKLRNPMNFLDRVENVFWAAFEWFICTAVDLFEWHYYQSNFPTPKYPSYFEARANASLILSSNHFSQDPVANVPQIVEIGGIQMDVQLAPLPGHLQRYLDEAENGVIFFSFGTNIQMRKQSQERLWSIFRALERTNMTVVLKWDTDEEIPGLPKNILSAEWLPQREILG